MAVPDFLASSHYYTSVADVDDVQDIIDALGTILKTTNSPAWTEPAGGTFKSPVDGDGRWYSVAVSRIDVDTLQFVVKDQYDNTIDTVRIDINASGSPACEVKIYSGQYHLWIDACLATYENFRSGILDLSPQAQDAWDTKVYCFAKRASDGSDREANDRLSTIDGTNLNGNIPFPNATGGVGVSADVAGNNIYWPVFCKKSTTAQLYGRMYQLLLGPDTLASGVEVTVPIDTGVTAKFRVAGPPDSGGTAGQSYRFLVRAD